MYLYHIIEREAWQAAQAAGQYSPPSLDQEGFIHTSTLAQVVDTANRFYPGQTGLLLLAIAAEALRSTLQFDPVTTHGEEQRFPHIYGPLNLDAVVGVVAFPPGPDGIFTLPADLPGA